MAIICPAVLAANETEFIRQLNLVASWASRIQIDLIDGQLPPADQPTVGFDQIAWPVNLEVDLHLMCGQPEKYLKQIKELKPSLVIFHPESSGDHEKMIKQLKACSIKVGLALRPQTRLLAARQLLDQADHGLVFGGDFGRQGGEADLNQLALVAWLRGQYPNLEVGWDGGINPDNAARLVRAGVDVLCVGSYLISAPDILVAYDELVAGIDQEDSDPSP